MRIRTDDEVIVIAGKDKGKTGKVLRTDPKKDRVFVAGPEHGQAPSAPATPAAPTCRSA